VTDANLRALREAGLLHKLSRAEGEGGTRPPSPEGVLTLNLDGTPVTAAGLRELAPFHYLALLNLAATATTDAGLKEVPAFKHLSTLVLSRTGVTDAGLKELEPLQKLSHLDLRDTRVTATGLRYLREALPHCQVVR
jgi:hypothetical protein